MGELALIDNNRRSATVLAATDTRLPRWSREDFQHALHHNREIAQYRIGYMVEDIRALIAHLGHDACILVGHDRGGMVAWTFALYYPEMLEKLVVINAPHPIVFDRELHTNETQQRLSAYLLRFRQEEPDILPPLGCTARPSEM